MKHLDVVLEEPKVKMIVLDGNRLDGYTAYISFASNIKPVCVAAHKLIDLDVEIIDKVEEALYG